MLRTQIDLSPFNEERRKRFQEANLLALGESLQSEIGQIAPCVVRPLPNGRHELVAGEQRYLAAGMVGMPTIDVVIREMTDKDVCDTQVAENFQRPNMLPVEEACILASMLKAKGADGNLIYRDMDELFPVTGRKRAVVERRLKLLNCPAFFLEAVDRGEVSASVGEEIGYLHPRQREDAAKKALHREFGMGAMTRDEFRELKARDYQISLKACGFDKSATDLLSGDDMQRFGFVKAEKPCNNDGSCEHCPWRTGNDKTIELATAQRGKGGTGGTSADVCTLPECFRAKVAAQMRLNTAASEGSGGRSMPAPKATKMLKSWDVDKGVFIVEKQKYICLDHTPGFEHCGHYGTDELPTWSELLEGAKYAPIMIHDKVAKVTRGYLESEEAVRLAMGNGHATLFAKGKVETEDRRLEGEAPVDVSDDGEEEAEDGAEGLEEKKRFAVLEALFDVLRRGVTDAPITMSFVGMLLDRMTGGPMLPYLARLLGLPDQTPVNDVHVYLRDLVRAEDRVGVMMGMIVLMDMHADDGDMLLSPRVEELCETVGLRIGEICRKVEGQEAAIEQPDNGTMEQGKPDPESDAVVDSQLEADPAAVDWAKVFEVYMLLRSIKQTAEAFPGLSLDSVRTRHRREKWATGVRHIKGESTNPLERLQEGLDNQAAGVE